MNELTKEQLRTGKEDMDFWFEIFKDMFEQIYCVDDIQNEHLLEFLIMTNNILDCEGTYKTNDARIKLELSKFFLKMVKKFLEKTYNIDLGVNKETNDYYNQDNEYKSNSNGFVYIIKDTITNIYKIGKTIDLEKRLKTLRCGNPKITLIASLQHKYYSAIELELHKKYKRKRLSGEWFDLTEKEVLCIIESYSFNLHLKQS